MNSSPRLRFVCSQCISIKILLLLSAPEDFTSLSDIQLQFSAGSMAGTTQSFTVGIIDDNEVEPMEDFFLSVRTNDTDAVAVRSNATGIINSEDGKLLTEIS